MSFATALRDMYKAFTEAGRDEENVELPKDLEKALKAIERQEEQVNKSINIESDKSSSNVGFTKKINPKTEEAMREVHDDVIKNSEKSIDER